jgi:ribosomal protein S18 acetylase RimI-like enzyme
MMQIRRFALCDHPELIQTINTVCGEGRWMCTTRFEPTSAWVHALEEPYCSCHLLLVVEDAGRVVGWCRTFPANSENDPQEATLGVGLLPKYRDQGIGTALVRESLTWAASTGYRTVSLTTHPDNARAIHVFSRCGFAFIQQANDNLLEMACDLSGKPITQGESSRENFLHSTGSNRSLEPTERAC